MGDRARIEHCVDQVCGLGCTFVNHVIEDLRRGNERPEYAHLDPNERQLLLGELVSIMAVYDSE